MIFRSKYANHVISLENGRSVRFKNGQLDTTSASRTLGIPEDELIKELKAGKYYGADYIEIEPRQIRVNK